MTDATTKLRAGRPVFKKEMALILGKGNREAEQRDAEREKVLRAFIAETGCLPSEIEQVTVHGQNGMRWYLRKRSATEPTREVK